MAKKKKKAVNEAVSQPTPEITEPIEDPMPEPNMDEEDKQDEIILSPDTINEIGSPDKDLVFLKVAKAYEEIKQTREKYKKIGPIVVFATAAFFLTLMFALDYKVSFLILWVATVLYIAALMIRAEYKYHQFRNFLGLNDEEAETDEINQADDPVQKDESGEEEQQPLVTDMPESAIQDEPQIEEANNGTSQEAIQEEEV